MSDFGVLSQFMNAYLGTITTGYSNIQASVNYILSFMIVFTMVTTALLTCIWGDWEATIRGLIGKILFIGFIVLLVQNWATYTDDIDIGLAQLGLKAGGSILTSKQFLNQPASIALQGYQIMDKMFQVANSMSSGWTGMKNIMPKLIYGLSGITVFMAYVVIALQVFVTYLEFKLINMAALVFVPFALWPKTSFLADKAFGYMFSVGIKLFVLALVVSIGHNFTALLIVNPTVDTGNVCSVMVAALVMMTVALCVPKLAQSLITGGPQLGAGDAAIGAGAAAAAIGGAGYFGGKALGAAAGAAGKGSQGDSFGQMARAGMAGVGGTMTPPGQANRDQVAAAAQRAGGASGASSSSGAPKQAASKSASSSAMQNMASSAVNGGAGAGGSTGGPGATTETEGT